MVYFFRKTPIVKKKTVERYLLVSDKLNAALNKVLTKDITLKPDLKNETILKNLEIILDGNVLTYKEIIDLIESTNHDKSTTYKILPKNSNFILGSDNAIIRGEILNFNQFLL